MRWIPVSPGIAIVAGLWLCGVGTGFAQSLEQETTAEAAEEEESTPAERVARDGGNSDAKNVALSEPSPSLPASSAAPAAPTVDSKAADRFLFFTGMDLWHEGGFAHGGFLWAHQGLNADGFVVKLLLNGGAYRYNSGGVEIIGRQMMASALPGWRFRRDGFELTVFAGLDVQEHTFTPDDPNRLRGTHVGTRGGFDVWYEPFANTMVTGSVSLSTVGMSYWTRAAAGYRVFDAWIGPEFIACGDDTYRQLRFGAHITSLRLTQYELSLGGGWVTDTDGRDGAYGRLGVTVKWDGVAARSIDSH